MKTQEIQCPLFDWGPVLSHWEVVSSAFKFFEFMSPGLPSDASCMEEIGSPSSLESFSRASFPSSGIFRYLLDLKTPRSAGSHPADHMYRLKAHVIWKGRMHSSVSGNSRHAYFDHIIRNEYKAWAFCQKYMLNGWNDLHTELQNLVVHSWIVSKLKLR